MSRRAITFVHRFAFALLSHALFLVTECSKDTKDEAVAVEPAAPVQAIADASSADGALASSQASRSASFAANKYASPGHRAET